MVYLNIFSSTVLSRDTENEINTDDYVVIENISNGIDDIDGTIVKNVQPEYFAEKKVEKNMLCDFETPKENNLQYVRFHNKCEINNGLNGKLNGEYCNESSSSNTSSSDSISFQRIVLTPIEENEVKFSNGYEN